MSEHPFNVEKYHEGIELFNDVEFFEAHDAWEELWQEYHAEGDAAKAVVSGSEKNGRVEPGGPDDSAELPSCDETQWANNPDGGRPELRRFENGEPVANATIDGNGTFNGKYAFWPDCEDFETDIETTCAGLGRDFCPYQPL